MKPKKFIQLINKTFPKGYLKHSGGCYKFHLILKAVYPEAIGYYDGNHVYTKIGNKVYDITGEVDTTIRVVPFNRPIRFDKCGGYKYFNKLFAEYL